MEAIAWGIAAALPGRGPGAGHALVRRHGRRDELAPWISGAERWEIDLRSGAVRRENVRPELPFEAATLEETRAALPHAARGRRVLTFPASRAACPFSTSCASC